MVEIKEFSAIRYNKEKIKKLNLDYKDIICPPYDVISEEMFKKLSRNKYNFVHLELPFGIKNLGNKKYDSVKKTLISWERSKILVKDDFPTIYVYEQIFYYPLINKNGKSYVECKKSGAKKVRDTNKINLQANKYTRRGIFCLVKIDPEYKTILPHEQTKPKPIEDRLNLLETLKIQTSPVFCLVEDSNKLLSKMLEKIVLTDKPFINFNDETGGIHKLYKLISKEKIELIKKFFVDKNLFIADGHHRYKTACEYLKKLQITDYKLQIKEKRVIENAGYFMSYICPLSDEGLLILPTHRAIAGKYISQEIDKYFYLSPWNGKKEADIVVYHSGEFKVMIPKKLQIPNCKLKIDDIPYVVLNETIFKNIPKEQIFYHQDMQEVIHWAEKYCGYAFLVPPLSKEKFSYVVRNRFLLPPKTTYFYPKVISGLCEYDLRY